MGSREIDLVPAGAAVAYDAKTGEILWAHQRVVEVGKGYEPGEADAISDDDCEALRKRAAEAFPKREIRVLAVRADTDFGSDAERSVDVASGRLVEREVSPPTLAQRFAREI